MKIIEQTKLYLTEYFDNMINDLDMNAEYLLISNSCNEKEIEIINELRKIYMSEIKRIKFKNIECYLNDCEEINEKIYKNESKIDDTIKKELFREFCFFVNTNSAIKFENYKIGFLVTTDWYLSSDEIFSIK